MTGQPRRKSGVYTPQELQQQASRAWANEAAKTAAAANRERDQRDRQAERDADIAAGHAEAEAVTRALQARLTELETLLVTALEENPYISFDQFKEPLDVPEFRPPPELATPGARPEENEFLPPPPSGMSALAPGRKRAYAGTVWDCPLLATCWVGLPVLSARIGRWLPAWQQCQQQWSTGDCSAQEGGQRWAHDDRGDPSGGQLVTDTALRRRRCSVMQPCGSRVEEGTRRCKHR